MFAIEGGQVGQDCFIYKGTLISSSDHIAGPFSIMPMFEKSILLYLDCNEQTVFEYELLGGFSGGSVLIVKGDDDGRQAWYCLLITDHEKQKESEKNRTNEKTNPFILTDYGIILDCGWGKHPPEGTTKRMEENFS